MNSIDLLNELSNIYTKTQTDTQISTAISNLVASAPTTLNTLNEIAAALNNDPNLATTLTNQIASKQPTITGAASTITTSNLTASSVLVSDTSGKVAASSVSNTQLGYLTGVNSNIQTQLDTRLTYSTGTAAASFLVF